MTFVLYGLKPRSDVGDEPRATVLTLSKISYWVTTIDYSRIFNFRRSVFAWARFRNGDTRLTFQTTRSVPQSALKRAPFERGTALRRSVGRAIRISWASVACAIAPKTMDPERPLIDGRTPKDQFPDESFGRLSHNYGQVFKNVKAVLSFDSCSRLF